MINVGIFWVIDKKVFYKIQQKDETTTSDIVDCDFSHFESWDDTCGCYYPNADFATYPRGRVMYETTSKTHLLYVDECIQQDELENIVNIFGLLNYQVLHDVHYSCDRCIKKRGNLF